MDLFKRPVTVGLELVVTPHHPSPGPWSLTDNIEFRVVLQIMAASRVKWYRHTPYQQYNTVRKLRTIFRHTFERSAGAAGQNRVLKITNKGYFLHMSSCLTNLLFFTRSMEGCLQRMWQDVQSDLTLNPRILHVILIFLNKNSLMK